MNVFHGCLLVEVAKASQGEAAEIVISVIVVAAVSAIAIVAAVIAIAIAV